jgi:hypothetical protein
LGGSVANGEGFQGRLRTKSAARFPLLLLSLKEPEANRCGSAQNNDCQHELKRIFLQLLAKTATKEMDFFSRVRASIFDRRKEQDELEATPFRTALQPYPFPAALAAARCKRAW